jgi:hypothetical protein
MGRSKADAKAAGHAAEYLFRHNARVIGVLRQECST